MFKCKRNFSLFFTLLFALTIFAACEDNPASSNEFGAHAEAVGFQLEIDGEILLRYFLREYTLDPNDNFPQYIKTESDDESLDYVHGGAGIVFSESTTVDNITDIITLRWIDRNEVVFDLPQLNEEQGGTAGLFGEWNLEFRYKFPNTSDVKPADERNFRDIYDKNEETWKFSFELLSEGRTDLRINLFHIDHADFIPRPLPVYIEM
jgi:hypothetical protein